MGKNFLRNHKYNIEAQSEYNNIVRSEDVLVQPGKGFYLGPTTPWHWYWHSGDKIYVTYPNGETVYWVCSETETNAPSPSFQGTHYVHLYDDNNRDQGSYLYYSDIQKIHIGGNSYKVIPSSERGYKYQVHGYKLYFNY